MNRAISLGVAILTILALSAPVAASQRPIVLEFEKAQAGAGYYDGTVDGGGRLQMWLFDSRVKGNTQHFSATVQVDGSTAGSFTAVVSGQINFSTGRAVLNGTVTDGDLEGARVQEESQLIGVSPLTFVGTIQIMPASS
jgi:hypothetical protein